MTHILAIDGHETYTDELATLWCALLVAEDERAAATRAYMAALRADLACASLGLDTIFAD